MDKQISKSNSKIIAVDLKADRDDSSEGEINDSEDSSLNSIANVLQKTKSKAVESAKKSKPEILSKEVKNLNNVLCDLFSAVVETNKDKANIVVSPFNLYMSLAMIAEGLKGNSLKEVSGELHFTSGDLVKKCLLDLVKTIGRNGLQDVSMKADNWFLTNKNVTVSEKFAEMIKEKYGFKTSSSDLSDPLSIKEIDDRIREYTNNEVKQGLSMISPSTFSMLVITAFFKGQWDQAFDANNTSSQSFTTAAGKQIDVDMMEKLNMSAGKMSNSHFDYLSIPYKNDSLVFVIEMGKDGKLSQKPDFVDIVKAASTKTRLLHVCIPKFKVHFSGKMVESIKKAGVSKIFMPSKEFQGISSHQMNVTNVIHNSFIDIEETGFCTSDDPTESDGDAMEGGFGGGGFAFQFEAVDEGCGAQAADEEFTANKPFYFHVVEVKNEVILFSGCITDPSTAK